MWQLNLPVYQFNIKNKNDKYYIFDKLRKKFVRLTPEEWVRQNFIAYIINEKEFPANRIAVEIQIKVNGLTKRCDAVYFNENMKPEIIFEFKSPQIRINQTTFDQASIYNTKLSVEKIIISNGLEHFFCSMNFENNKPVIDHVIPHFNDL